LGDPEPGHPEQMTEKELVQELAAVAAAAGTRQLTVDLMHRVADSGDGFYAIAAALDAINAAAHRLPQYLTSALHEYAATLDGGQRQLPAIPLPHG
jgi:hypothetical protein